MFPHHVDDNSPDQRVFHNKRIQIRRRVLHDRSHNIDTTTASITGQSSWMTNQRSRKQCIQAFEVALTRVRIVMAETRVLQGVFNAKHIVESVCDGCGSRSGGRRWSDHFGHKVVKGIRCRRSCDIIPIVGESGSISRSCCNGFFDMTVVVFDCRWSRFGPVGGCGGSWGRGSGSC